MNEKYFRNIVFENEEHLKKILKTAVDNGSIFSLVHKLDYFETFGRDDCMYYQTIIYPDGDNFFFVIRKFNEGNYQYDKLTMNGGIIYHKNQNLWAIHT